MNAVLGDASTYQGVLWSVVPGRDTCILDGVLLPVRGRFRLCLGALVADSHVLESRGPFFEIDHAVLADIYRIKHIFDDREVGLGHFLLRILTKLVNELLEILERQESLFVLRKLKKKQSVK